MRYKVTAQYMFKWAFIFVGSLAGFMSLPPFQPTLIFSLAVGVFIAANGWAIGKLLFGITISIRSRSQSPNMATCRGVDLSNADIFEHHRVLCDEPNCPAKEQVLR